MRILRSMKLCLLCLILLTTSAGAANHETSYDIYAKPDGKTSWQIQIENDKPIYQSDKTVARMMADEATATKEFAHVWYNLLQGEMAHGIDVKDSFASDIYKGMTEKQVLISMIAEDADAICVNYIVGVFNKKKDTRFKQYFGNIYWIEWNTEDQKLQATNLVDSVERLKDAYDIMYSYLYYSWMINAAGGNTILNKQLPLDSVLFQLTGGKKLQNALNEVYAEQNDGLKPFKISSGKNPGVSGKKNNPEKETEQETKQESSLALTDAAKPEITGIEWSDPDDSVVLTIKRNGVKGDLYHFAYNGKADDDYSQAYGDLIEDTAEVTRVVSKNGELVPGETYTYFLSVDNQTSERVEIRIPTHSEIVITTCSIPDFRLSDLTTMKNKLYDTYEKKGYDAYAEIAQGMYEKYMKDVEFSSTGFVKALITSPSGQKDTLSMVGGEDSRDKSFGLYKNLGFSFVFHLPVEKGQYTVRFYDWDKKCLLDKYTFSVK